MSYQDLNPQMTLIANALLEADWLVSGEKITPHSMTARRTKELIDQGCGAFNKLEASIPRGLTREQAACLVDTWVHQLRHSTLPMDKPRASAQHYFKGRKEGVSGDLGQTQLEAVFNLLGLLSLAPAEEEKEKA